MAGASLLTGFGAALSVWVFMSPGTDPVADVLIGAQVGVGFVWLVAEVFL